MSKHSDGLNSWKVLMKNYKIFNQVYYIYFNKTMFKNVLHCLRSVTYVYSIHYTVYTIHDTVYSIHYTVYSTRI